jgi:hypothetical protein
MYLRNMDCKYYNDLVKANLSGSINTFVVIETACGTDGYIHNYYGEPIVKVTVKELKASKVN